MYEKVKKLPLLRTLRWKNVYKTLDIGRKSGKGVLSATKSKNCVRYNGSLEAAFGFFSIKMNYKDLQLPADLPASARYFGVIRKTVDGEFKKTIAFLSVTNEIYMYIVENEKWELQTAFSSPVTLIQTYSKTGEPRLFAVGESGIYEHVAHYFCPMDETPYSTKACVCMGRLFVAQGDFTLVYTAPYGEPNFRETLRESGKMSFPNTWGKIVAVETLNGKVIVVFEYGIGELETSGSATEFKYKDILRFGKRIYENSVAVCSADKEYLAFLSEDGIYRFDGGKVEKIEDGMDVYPYVENPSCKVATTAGWYYIGYNDTETGARAALVDLGNKKAHEWTYFSAVGNDNGKMLCEYLSEMRYFGLRGWCPNSLKPSFTVENENFGKTGRKTLKSLVFNGVGTFIVTVRGDGIERRLETSAVDGRARVDVNIQAESFDVTVEMNTGSRLTCITAECERLIGVKE